MKNLPTFLVIGAHKGGTSWLYQQFINHPQIWMPPVKELHFFDLDLDKINQQNLSGIKAIASRLFGSNAWEKTRSISTVKSIGKSVYAGNFVSLSWWLHWTFGKLDEQWYQNLFIPGRSYTVCADITPAYSILDESKISLIKAINPDIKIIFMLRNPVARAWSAAKYNYQRGSAKFSLDSTKEIIAALNRPQFEMRGNYERTIDNYLKYFDSSQILVCFYEAIASDSIGLITGITDFIGVPQLPTFKIDSTSKVNASSNKKIPQDLKDYLIEKYAPMNNRLAKRLGSYATLWDGVDNSTRENISSALTPWVHL